MKKFVRNNAGGVIPIWELKLGLDQRTFLLSLIRDAKEAGGIFGAEASIIYSLEESLKDTLLYRCADPDCQGLPFKASDIAHRGTCRR